MEKPSTLHLPSPDQQISARWLVQRMRAAMVKAPPPKEGKNESARLEFAMWEGYNRALLEFSRVVTRRAHAQAAKAYQAAKRAKR